MLPSSDHKRRKQTLAEPYYTDNRQLNVELKRKYMTDVQMTMLVADRAAFNTCLQRVMGEMRSGWESCTVPYSHKKCDFRRRRTLSIDVLERAAPENATLL